jgi:hypothetical protein
VQKALREAGVPQDEVSQFTAEATSGDYGHLLQTCMEWSTLGINGSGVQTASLEAAAEHVEPPSPR